MNRLLFCGLAALITSAAATHAAVVQVGNNYEDSDSIICASTQFCNLSFAQVAADKRLTVSGVHCDFYAQNGVLLTARFGAFPAPTRLQPMPLSYTSVAGGFRYYTARLETTKRIFEAGSRPRVTVTGFKTGSSNINIQITCQLIGVLSTVN